MTDPAITSSPSLPMIQSPGPGPGAPVEGLRMGLAWVASLLVLAVGGAASFATLLGQLHEVQARQVAAETARVDDARRLEALPLLEQRVRVLEAGQATTESAMRDLARQIGEMHTSVIATCLRLPTSPTAPPCR